ncbi:MAG TPA: hypothetical protein DD490_14110 [Acidobacteria bacterium]|nr:hypothetical protein [Acidobacteriota bacterium]
MTILLTGSASFDLAAMARELARCGLDSEVLPVLPSAGGMPGRLPRGIDRAVLVLPALEVLEIGEEVAHLREALDSGISLLVCCPQLTPGDRRAVLDCGASSLVAPRSWDGHTVAERVLGELILAGDVAPFRCGDLWGGTALQQDLYRRIETVAPLHETVLILGDTGTGKERVAQEIHRRSGRPGELMAVNSAELTAELMASELFGHERGAFSGADRQRMGLLVAAGEGTFFLDEIGDLTPSAQAKLLRVLEERKVRPVGGNRWEPVRARLVLATRRDLETAPEEQFRRDLYERLRGFTLRLPPLRERRADLPLLVQSFLDEYNREYPGARKVPAGVLDTLFRYTWPGNVRELRLAVRQAAAYAAGPDGTISALHLLEAAQRQSPQAEPDHLVRFDPARESWRQVNDRVRARYFRAILAETDGNKEMAAERAGISRSQLYDILKNLGEG